MSQPNERRETTLEALVQAIGYTQAHVASTCADGHDLTPPQLLLDAIEAMRSEVERYRTALERITLGEGRFSLDQLTHAENTIDAMKELAQEALSEHSRSAPLGSPRSENAT